MTHLLVTNDFPPKVGGIQSYLYELWRRLPPDRFAVLTIAHEHGAAFDDVQPFPIRRLNVSMLHPRRAIRTEIERYAHEIGATHVVLDPVLPIGLIGPKLSLPYSLIVHGAEVRIPAHLPIARSLMRRAITHAEFVVAAGRYPASEVRAIGGLRTPPIVIIPPGVDVARFQPLTDAQRREARARYGVGDDALCVVSVSRLVPRKGMDVLIKASSILASRYPNLIVLIGGTGRDTKRLERLIARNKAPVHLIGRVDDEALAPLFGLGDVAAMVCRDRWFGLEQEGFGIVFLEAAATGTATLAGDSGGASEAVADRETGIVVGRPSDVQAVVDALDAMLCDASLREAFGRAGRVRAVREFSYDHLAHALNDALLHAESV